LLSILLVLTGLNTARAEETKPKVLITIAGSAEAVSAYVWRGQYLGGLSFQPNLDFTLETGMFSSGLNVWGNVGASDWVFSKNTYFVPELDLNLYWSLAGFSIAATHFYYCDGTNFFNWRSVDAIVEAGGTSQTEIQAGFTLDDLLDRNFYLNWNTFVAGNDIVESGDGYKRAWSSYLEVGYEFKLPKDIALDIHLGMSPWKSNIYGNEKFAVINIGGRLGKTWSWEHVELELFGQGSINPDGLNRDNAYVNAAGDEPNAAGYIKADQRLNGAIGLGIHFIP